MRLADIDAPETYQPFGIEARGALRAFCPNGTTASVIWRSRDRDRRIIGRVRCQGIDVNAAMVEQGAAWVYVKYAPKGSYLYPIESRARASGIGLWYLRNPIAPWEWRAARRTT